MWNVFLRVEDLSVSLKEIFVLIHNIKYIIQNLIHLQLLLYFSLRFFELNSFYKNLNSKSRDKFIT